ncbi:hypothetical protein U0C82_13185 [Fulvimarina sp. 2208YS6-2-32]|uniref:Uncharacterized protein n=1 Tax=Fulvimarina uroteuthidis TaxID=3098149 RepID=A0ABU5I4S6_9HYPH|nr:hypothetical protein [Fulvimarina sp. 2208YS6-2-32]MDY8110095.1 hypothetical protein [Fulvimarina sp. 2208YS6-2-32]
MPGLRFETRRLSVNHLAIGLAGFILALVAIGWATRTPPGQTPTLTIAGSGFLFNYRIGEVSYGFTAIVNKPVRRYSKIEAVFEDPQGGPPMTVVETLTARSTRYSVRSPPVRGVEKGKPYQVAVRLIQNIDGAILFDDRFTVTSQMSDDVVPDAPLTVGPGYARNPASSGAGPAPGPVPD